LIVSLIGICLCFPQLVVVESVLERNTRAVEEGARNYLKQKTTLSFQLTQGVPLYIYDVRIEQSSTDWVYSELASKTFMHSRSPTRYEYSFLERAY
jgi:hypothetical protein